MKTKILIAIAALALIPPAGHLAAQEPGVERLERLRLERMRDALELTEQQAAELTERMEENRENMREAMEAHRAAMTALREDLREEPVDQNAVDRALVEVESRRQAMGRLREEQHERTIASLTPEQRAKMLLFSREFDGHLRELMARHRAPRPEMRGGPAPRGQAPGIRRRGPGPERRGAPMDREARMERIRRQIETLQRQLAELEAEPGS